MLSIVNGVNKGVVPVHNDPYGDLFKVVRHSHVGGGKGELRLRSMMRLCWCLSQSGSALGCYTPGVFFFKNIFFELPLEHESFPQTRQISCCNEATLFFFFFFGSSVRFSNFPHYPIMMVVRNSDTKANNRG